ncbi:Arylacetamide deacetylase [Phaffia rhodozyma]|uniref:Arylacetamide deacetylase n=1 Tax=Phaffia rhodozyma TaxID=264483 RepID=A0A0F7SSZ7_PHARH|nr:Arylacetamide deacetylase [Phaffia rhodozyma]
MTLGVPVIAAHTTPVVISTFFKHVLRASGTKKRRRPRKGADSQSGENLEASANPDGKPRRVGSDGQPGDGGEGDSRTLESEAPEHELAYDEGLQIVKAFLKTAKSYSVEELQSFTAMHVPNPNWIHLSPAIVPQSSIDHSTEILQSHFKQVYGESGLKEIGGEKWWQIRGKSLEGEWIEMKKDYLNRTVGKVQKVMGQSEGPLDKSQQDRVILYIHGGAYFFSSLDTHRYQIQRHARKLGGRAFAPSYRLSPQYPFPCGLHDALASYLYLIDPPAESSQAPIAASDIVISGDSAGAGLILALLCVIRDSGGKVPLPAGACLISPWVDLTHSFKSIMGDDSRDYIPSEGFHYKPSLAWPPIKGDSIEFDVENPRTGEKHVKVLDDQVQMYASNKLLQHPLVSPINQGSLGGLCPLMIMGGSGELLRDEMVFLAHKAADPEAYPPSSSVLKKYPGQKDLIGKYPPTKVHLQMYDGCAHVTPTLSFTKPAKWMYRAAANFNIWAITAARYNENRHSHHHHRHHEHSHKPGNDHEFDRTSTHSSLSFPPEAIVHSTSVFHKDGQTTAIPITESAHRLANETDHTDDLESEADSSECEMSDGSGGDRRSKHVGKYISVTGTEPEFVNSMIRERVTVHGVIRPMEPVSQSETFQGLDLNKVGIVHGAGPIQKWLSSRHAWDKKYSKELASFQAIKTSERKLASQQGWLTKNLHGETPPLSSVVGWSDETHAAETAKSVDRVGRQSGAATSVMKFWMKAGEQNEAAQAGSAEISSAEAKLKDLGVKSPSTVRLVGNENLETVRNRLIDQGLDVPASGNDTDLEMAIREEEKRGLLDRSKITSDKLVEPKNRRLEAGQNPIKENSIGEEIEGKDGSTSANHPIELGQPLEP